MVASGSATPANTLNSVMLKFWRAVDSEATSCCRKPPENNYSKWLDRFAE
jgi:hypothetical protein